MREVATVIADALTPVCMAARINPEVLAGDVMLALHRQGYHIVPRKAVLLDGDEKDAAIVELGRLIQAAHRQWLAMGAPGAKE